MRKFMKKVYVLHWWGANSGRLTYTEKNLYKCYLFEHTAHKD